MLCPYLCCIHHVSRKQVLYELRVSLDATSLSLGVCPYLTLFRPYWACSFVWTFIKVFKIFLIITPSLSKIEFQKHSFNTHKSKGGIKSWKLKCGMYFKKEFWSTWIFEYDAMFWCWVIITYLVKTCSNNFKWFITFLLPYCYDLWVYVGICFDVHKLLSLVS